MTVDLDKLEALARAATSGPWCLCIEDGKCWGVYQGSKDGDWSSMVDAERIVETDSGVYPPDMPTAAYIAACSPSTILALIERLRLLDEARVVAEQIFDDGGMDDVHADDCPQDDTCDCEWVHRINLLFALLQGRDDVADRVRAALRGEGEG